LRPLPTTNPIAINTLQNRHHYCFDDVSGDLSPWVPSTKTLTPFSSSKP